MPGCSRPPVTSASRRNRWRLAGSAACRSRICLSATSRCNSLSRRHEDRPQPTLGMGPQDAKPLGVAGRLADGQTRRAVDLLAALGRVGAEVGKADTDQGIVDLRQALAGRTARRNRGEAPPHVAAVLLDVPRHEDLDGGAVVSLEITAGNEVGGQGPVLVERPGLEGGDELNLIDQAILYGAACRRASRGRWRWRPWIMPLGRMARAVGIRPRHRELAAGTRRIGRIISWRNFPVISAAAAWADATPLVVPYD